MTNYELFWLRELPGGALGGEYGGKGKTLADLPINETLAGRIHRLSVPGTTVNLHLPYLSYRDRKVWPAMQLDLPVKADDAGRIMVGDEADHQYAAILAAPGLAGYSAPIIFRDERVWKASAWDTAVVPMLAAHKFQIDRGWKPSGPVNLRWTIELPSNLANGWAQVSHRREAKFLDEFRGVSTSLQMALRTWLPFQYFAQSERYTKPIFAHPYLVYGILPPHPSRRKTQLTFHVLEPQRVVRSMGRLGKPMAERLRRVLVQMANDGVEDRDSYRLDQAGHIVRLMHSLPRTFAALLSLEAYIVEEFVRFASVAYEMRQAPLRARLLVDPGLELLHNVRSRLARSYGGETYPNLANLVLVAATAGLFWRQEPGKTLRARVVATDLESGREFHAESRFSYAISDRSRH
jgi:hypothetical protein